MATLTAKPVTENTYTLEMSHLEAETLFRLLHCHIGGNMEGSRWILNDLSETLNHVDFSSDDLEIRGCSILDLT